MKDVKAIHVVVRTKFEGFHRWKDAPDEVGFLRNVHRHLFGVEVVLNATHEDREVEFFIAQRDINSLLAERWEGQVFEASCEMIACWLGEQLIEGGYDVVSITVDEDGENAGRIIWEDGDDVVSR